MSEIRKRSYNNVSDGDMEMLASKWSKMSAEQLLGTLLPDIRYMIYKTDFWRPSGNDRIVFGGTAMLKTDTDEKIIPARDRFLRKFNFFF